MEEEVVVMEEEEEEEEEAVVVVVVEKVVVEDVCLKLLKQVAEAITRHCGHATHLQHTV